MALAPIMYKGQTEAYAQAPMNGPYDNSGDGIAKPKPEDSDTIITAGKMTNYYVTRITIGPEITQIADGAFINLHRLKSITVSPNNPYYSSYSNCLYNKDKTELLCVPMGLSAAQFPSTMKEINRYALKGHSAAFNRSVRDIAEQNRKK